MKLGTEQPILNFDFRFGVFIVASLIVLLLVGAGLSGFQFSINTPTPVIIATYPLLATEWYWIYA
jgi:hypothetical protein